MFLEFGDTGGTRQTRIKIQCMLSVGLCVCVYIYLYILTINDIPVID